MRTARDNSILEVKGKSSKKPRGVVGVNLGADYCAEHEWGIKRIRDKFGMTSDGIGIENKRIRYVSEDLVFVTDKYTGLFCDHLYERTPTQYLDNYHVSRQGLWTAWDEKSFAVITMDGTHHDDLRTIHQAFLDLDIAIWLGGGGVFQNAGLCFGIISKLSKDITDMWAKHDLEAKQLDEDVKKLGILERLAAAGLGPFKGYFACSPKRIDGKIMFWLNPFDQQNNNYGWYTVKDLDDWIAGKGKVIK
jgi:hypothetical protein